MVREVSLKNKSRRLFWGQYILYEKEKVMKKVRSLVMGLGMFILAVSFSTLNTNAAELQDETIKLQAEDAVWGDHPINDEQIAEKTGYLDQHNIYEYDAEDEITVEGSSDLDIEPEGTYEDTGETSGTFDNGIHWEITGSGTSLKLSFSGTGALPDSMYWDNPWNKRKNLITSVVFEEGITAVSDRAFSDYSTLRTVKFPESLKTIGQSSFSNCGDLNDVEIPSMVETIGGYAFSGCKELELVTFEEGSHLTLIDFGAFSNTGISFMDIPQASGETVIGQNAFSGSEIAKVTIPSSVTEIGIDAFASSHLQRITFAEGSRLEKIGQRAFYNSRLTQIDFPETTGTLEVGDQVCEFCSYLINVSLSSTTKGSGVLWFSGCNELKQVTFPANGKVTSIGQQMFASCRSLEKIEIPNYVTTVGTYAFSGCSSMKQAVIPDSVTYIDKSAFYGSGLESVTIPASVEKINESVFGDCNNLVSVSLPSSIKTIEAMAFSNSDKLPGITIPASVTMIGSSAFNSCNSLQTVIVEKDSKLMSINQNAFAYCRKLNIIVLPVSLLNIGDYAFSYTEALSDVYYTGSQADWSNVIIEKYNDPIKNATIHFNYDYSKLPDIPDPGPGPDPTPENAGVVVVGQKINLTGAAYFGQAYTSYKVSNTRFGSVNAKGLFTPKKATASVTVTAYNGKGRKARAVKSITFKIEKPEVSKDKKTITLIKRGETMDAGTVLTGTNVKPSGFVSSKPSVVSVDPETGLVTALEKGSAKITILFGSADPKDRNAAKYSFNVKSNLPVMSKKTATVTTGQKISLKLNNVDKSKTVTWESSSNAVTVADGNVEVVSWQEEPVIVSAIVDQVSYTCSITIKKPELSRTQYTVKAGGKAAITFKNTMLKAPQMSFVSSDPEIAEAEPATGKIMGKKTGTCDITVTVGGVDLVCNVIVK